MLNVNASKIRHHSWHQHAAAALELESEAPALPGQHPVL